MLRTVFGACVFLGLGSCAPSAPAPAAVPALAQRPATRATIVAMRPVASMPPGEAGAGTGGRALEGLARLAKPDPGGRTGQPVAVEAAQPMDFIVREPDGTLIAVTQTNEAGLRVGDAVVLVRGDRTRLARPGS